MTSAHILGFPRIGAHRELKFAQEAYWHGEVTESTLRDTGSDLRARHWALQQQAGLDYVSVGDFAWYDQVLTTLALFGALPARFGFSGADLSLADYFVAARGNAQHHAMEMTKWFDTNYHYLVPEWTAETRFDGGVDWLFDELAEAQALGHAAKVTLIGPLSLLYLGKVKNGLAHPLDLLHKLLPAYQKVLARLQQAGVEWLQIDEPILALDLDAQWLKAFLPAYTALATSAPKLLLATYFEAVQDRAALLHSLPVAAVHLDLVRAPQQLECLLANWPQERILSAGVIDGRNIWRADLSALLAQLQGAHQQLGARLWIASSCSLLHVPVDLANETALDQESKNWLAFASQKLAEIVALKQALNGNGAAVAEQFKAADLAVQSRRNSSRIHNPAVKKRLASIAEQDAQRHSVFAERILKQQQRFQLPLFPTTSIGSFPQTKAIRQARAAYKRGQFGHLAYLDAMRAEIRLVVERQEQLGIDVLVHGEPERNDMVEYFGEQLWGYGFTLNGWVQSYGSRCVKPPFIYGDVYRPEAMTVAWSQYAQSLTDKPMKGMLTGPVTMLQWAFVRDDQPRATTALQIALALRDEVADLEKAGIGMIQIDEPAFREGLPLKRKDWASYLDWAVRAFKLSSAGVNDDTQIHTHMCYAEFNDILPWIAAMDADVITIETSRSDMELLDGFGDFAYPNDIGPGVYDIHSPRVPRVSEMQRLLQKARSVIPDKRLWVNPDCGLKTRDWPETAAALENMVRAAKLLRAAVAEEREHIDCC
ncbi:MAG: 5-methyltetrahydropteroyltriglutamate--homocysteine S-methyltransferase [Undibacterium sp.]|uniref:5-methyltetrahydropteroyltriglutamate-- homocysteine S-methyltransferase n=1 Tax=Undibacterium sp. TaxID=1914977 RepID=UPI0027173CCE|nr:5-methyltetrahydropteroyltriglutamate--homocysteine S-methyltransferase [Undibacterium sp.]MDO8651900.1 5-methyltetrahydropteroyltriglutamate--homocysteine S-methyltransferase [Undibacterium sp.]